MRAATHIRAARISTGAVHLEKRECDISQLTLQVFETFTGQFESAGIEATIDVKEGLTVDADCVRVEQAINNLLSNAIKYGGAKPIRLRAWEANGDVHILIEDKGRGVAKTDQARIFERFERAVSASEVSGLGLGLFISRQIMEAHGGQLLLESEPGSGSKFEIILPVDPRVNES